MPHYSYKAYTAKGVVEVGDILASSSQDAFRVLNSRGLLPFYTEEIASNTKASTSWLLWSNQVEPSPSDYADFTRELSVLLQADLPIDDGLRLIVAQRNNRAVTDLATKLLADVLGGHTFSSALEQHASSAPAIVSSLVRAGEASGNLATTLTELAQFLETRVEMQSRIRSALTYPLVLAITALAAIGIVITFLVPTLLPLYTDNGAEPPRVLWAADAAATAVIQHWRIAVVVVIASLLSGKAILSTQRVIIALDSLRLRLPFFGDLSRSASIAIFAKTLGILLKNGVALIQALQITAEVVSNSTMSASIRSATEAVKEGQKLTTALERTGQFTLTSLRFIAIGEEASRLDQMLLHLAQLTDKATHRKIDRAMTLLGPALTVIIGLMVGGLIVSVMQAILSVNDLVLR